ncbi:DUF927 domain-containing protein [Mesorhizobium sp. IMUNJ 23232]|uniref:DUF927 domain-containing protein n=1 Tax=Mesorhizobium sp. IMUNJ 23232 TaxID=3376064 RepID=UPI0037A9CE12
MISPTKFITGDGSEWLQVKKGGRAGYGKIDYLIENPTAFWAQLKRQKLTIISHRSRKEIIDAAENLVDSEPALHVGRYGWYDRQYVKPGDELPDRIDGLPVISDLPANARPWAHNGTIDGWQTGVAHLCEGQAIPTFVMSCAFASLILKFAPSISDNPFFELADDTSGGKSTMLELSASVFGKTEDWIDNWDTTVNGLEEKMALAADSILQLDEENHFMAGGGTKETLASTIFKLASGSEKARFGQDTARKFRFLGLSTANQPIASLLSTIEKSRADAVKVRLATIPVNAPFGCFDTVPSGEESSADAILAVKNLARDHHGHAAREFLGVLKGRYLSRSFGAELLKRKIARYMQEFRDLVGGDLNRPEGRLLDKFALVYAGGRLAYRFRVLPFRGIGPAVLQVYRRSQIATRSEVAGTRVSAIDEVMAFLERGKSQSRIVSTPADLTEKEFDDTSYFLKVDAGTKWALITSQSFRRAFGFRSDEVLADLHRAGLLRAKDGRQSQVRLRTSKSKDRVYQVQVPMDKAI